MKEYRIYLMIQLAQSMGVMSKNLKYDLAWKESEKLYDEYAKTTLSMQDKTDYECIQDFLETKEKTAFRNCHNCSEKYLPTPDWSFCPHCLSEVL